MSGVTTLVDTILATRLAQRVDLVPLRSQLEVAGPEPVMMVEKVDNDVRLSSRAALQQQLGVGLLASGGRSQPSQSASPDGAVTLSVVARTVSAILDLPSGELPRIRGSEPLWPHLLPPVAQLLATTLEGAVATSGLFYESHLQEYAAGTRTLAQLSQEPQAHLVMPSTVIIESLSANQTNPSAAQTRSPPSGPAQLEPVASLDADLKSLPVGLAVSLDSNKLAATYGYADPYVANHSSAIEIDGLASDTEHSEPGSLDSVLNRNTATVIHPDSLALVRQQLDFLALPVFSWRGEAFPGIPMEWEISEEHDDSHAATNRDKSEQTWITHLVITLPTLKLVEMHLHLTGASLHLRLDARENSTVALLGDEGHELTNRLNALGMKLAGLQIGELTVAPLAPLSPLSPNNDSDSDSDSDGDGDATYRR